MTTVSRSGPTLADDDLARRVGLFIEQQRLTVGARLAIDARSGTITIRGTAATFHQRQCIVSAMRRVAGVSQIVDKLDVDPPRSIRSSARPATQSLAVVVSTLAIVVAMVLAGCGKSGPPRAETHPTKGMVTYQGQPIGGAFLALHSKSGSADDVPTSTAVVQADGKFAVTTYDAGDGVPAGDYVVTIQWRKLTKSNGDFVPGPNLLPAKYSRRETSDVVIHVAAGNNDLAPIVLKR